MDSLEFSYNALSLPSDPRMETLHMTTGKLSHRQVKPLDSSHGPWRSGAGLVPTASVGVGATMLSLLSIPSAFLILSQTP